MKDTPSPLPGTRGQQFSSLHSKAQDRRAANVGRMRKKQDTAGGGPGDACTPHAMQSNGEAIDRMLKNARVMNLLSGGYVNALASPPHSESRGSTPENLLLWHASKA